MWHSLFSYVKILINGQNQFASGGFLLMIIGGIAASLRKIPAEFMHHVEHQTTMTLTVKDDDTSFWWLKMWFAEQQFTQKIRRLDTVTINNERRANDYTIKLIPAPGVHWFWRGWRPFRMTFTRQDEPKGYSNKRVETLTFFTYGRNRKVLQSFLDDVHQTAMSRLRPSNELYVWDSGSWDSTEAYKPRTMESVILPKGQKEDLLADIKRFLAAEKRYDLLGLPYHRGYLLYGSPGSGKTSLASALANHLNMSLYVLNLNDFNDKSLDGALSQVQPRSVILFEDIDCMNSAKKRSKKKIDPTEKIDDQIQDAGTLADLIGTTPSGLLNALDGLAAPQSVVYLMTTNHIDKLDAALIRPGRIDYRLEMDIATIDQKQELFARFFPDTGTIKRDNFIADHPTNTMAEFQGELLKQGLLETEKELHMNADRELVAAISYTDWAFGANPNGTYNLSPSGKRNYD